MLHRFTVRTILENYVKNSHLNRFNLLKRYQVLYLDFDFSPISNRKKRFVCRFLGVNMSDEIDVFNGTVDRYNGITIDTENEVVGEQFAEKLKSMCTYGKCYVIDLLIFDLCTQIPSHTGNRIQCGRYGSR